MSHGWKEEARYLSTFHSNRKSCKGWRREEESNAEGFEHGRTIPLWLNRRTSFLLTSHDSLKNSTTSVHITYNDRLTISFFIFYSSREWFLSVRLLFIYLFIYSRLWLSACVKCEKSSVKSFQFENNWKHIENVYLSIDETKKSLRLAYCYFHDKNECNETYSESNINIFLYIDFQ